MLLNGKHRRDPRPKAAVRSVLAVSLLWGFTCPALPFLPWKRIALGLPTASYCLVGFPEKCGRQSSSFWGRRWPRTKSAISSLCVNRGVAAEKALPAPTAELWRENDFSWLRSVLGRVWLRQPLQEFQPCPSHLQIPGELNWEQRTTNHGAS